MPGLDMGWSSPSSGHSRNQVHAGASDNKPSVIYSRISRGALYPLVEASPSEVESNCAEFVDQVQLCLKAQDDKSCRSLTHQGHIVHLLIEEDVWFLAVTPKQITRQVAFAFLEALHDAFVERFGPLTELPPAASVKPFYLQDDFEQPMLALLDKFRGASASRSLVGKASDRVKGIRNNMVEALEAVAKTSGQLSLVVARTDALHTAAAAMKATAMAVRRKHRADEVLEARARSHRNGLGCSFFDHLIAQFCGGRATAAAPSAPADFPPAEARPRSPLRGDTPHSIGGA
eukprot:TRINITY_DN41989_c0_g2_i1.p1 TRINITY_DN41989_c0_g2~~TRINITY_DN41989_c0_g2_i1.p1  ORF type:complete len:289 (+),score=57.12 TRINITY_DN41989_c0_g2_i1:124-990(+)